MSTIGYSTLDVIPSAAGFAKKLASQIEGPLAAAGKSSGSSLGKLIERGAFAGIGAAFAGLGIVLKTGIKRAMEASAGQAQLTAGIKSTGNAAGVTVKGLEDLAKAVQNYSGQSKESIVTTEQLLLTFSNIRNTGPHKIFDQATVAAANMAAKFGGDASQSAIILGKALNNPTRGVALLTRVGVQFTEGQVSSIRAMMKHGDVIGAQTIILEKLTQAYGGAAKAAGDSLPGQVNRAKQAFADAAQVVAEKLLPVVLPAILSIANAITTKAVPAIGRFIDQFKDSTGAGGELKKVLVSLYKDGLKPILDIVNKYQSSFGGLALKLAVAFAGFEAMKGIIKLVGILTTVIGTVVKATAAFRAFAMSEAAVAALDPFAWVAVAVAGMSYLLVKLWQVHDAQQKVGAWKQRMRTADWEQRMRFAATGSYDALDPKRDTKPTKAPKPPPFPVPPADPTALVAAINLKIAVESQKQTLRDFIAYLTKEFPASLSDGATKASDLISKFTDQVSGAASGFAATISNQVKQAQFNLGAEKITNALNVKLSGLGSAFDAIQAARAIKKTEIDDATKALEEAIKVRSDASSAIAGMLSAPFGQPSELTKAFSGAEATVDTILGGYNNLVKLVQERFTKIEGPGQDQLVAFLKDQAAKLIGLVKERAEIAKEFDKAQTNLEKIIQTKIDYAAGISSGLKAAGASLTEFVQSVTLADGLTVKMISNPNALVAAFQARLTAVKNFAANVQALAGRGLNQNLIDQVLGMGADSGGALASSLTTATADQIAALNDTQREIGATADTLGASLADKFYGQSVSQAQSLLDGWASKQTAINDKMSAIAKAIADKMSPLTDAMAKIGSNSATALLEAFKTQDNALLEHAKFIGAQMAQAIADALAALNVISGGPNFPAGTAKEVAASLGTSKMGVAVGDASGVPAAAKQAAAKEIADELRNFVEELKAAPKPATGEDILALGNQISETLYGSNLAQARKLQQMARQGG